ncbi:MAG: D-glycero-beta-D-manno-heptose 1-phosphate adenylyltransferase [Saprospiraceae bacterium]
MLDFIESKIHDSVSLQKTLSLWRFGSKKIVFTNGCFDLLHQGHLQYLMQARMLGDKLVIGLNSDASTRKLKGETRPINDQRSRSMMLATMIFVDAVVIFDEETPYELINIVRPDILVKGGDYNPETIVGADLVKSYGGSVKVLSFLDGFSSTAIETKIINSAAKKQ